MQCFAIVRDADALAAACEGLSGLLAHTRRAGGGDPELLGIWLDPVRVVEVPTALRPAGPGAGDGRAREIAASAGLSGLWTLCWLEGPPLDRRSLVAALAREVRPTAAADGTGRFHPVLPHAGGAAAHHRELRALAARHGDLIRSPVFLDRDSGHLAPPPESTPWPRAQSS